jgi:uncharacterized protein (DUF58 family)
VLLNGVYDLDSTRRSADYPAAVNQLLARQKRRALVVLVTNVQGEDDSELLNAIRHLGQHHQVLVVSLQEAAVEPSHLPAVNTLQEALTYCATVDYLNARANIQQRLNTHGLAVLDTPPEHLSTKLASRYLGWKKAGLL